MVVCQDESEGEWSAAFLLENRKVGPFSRLGDGRALTPNVSPNIDDRLAAVLSKYGGIGRRKKKKENSSRCLLWRVVFVCYICAIVDINHTSIYFLPPSSSFYYKQSAEKRLVL